MAAWGFRVLGLGFKACVFVSRGREFWHQLYMEVRRRVADRVGCNQGFYIP